MLKLSLPPGFFANGTEYSGAGRYINGDLVRWDNGFIKPIRGWQPRADVVTPDLENHPTSEPIWTAHEEAVRSGVIINDTTYGIDVYLGTNKHIYKVSNSNVITDVTPSEFTDQLIDADLLTGYGMYRYGYGQYGTPRPAQQGRVKNAFSWSFADWGYWPIAAARQVPTLPLFIKTDSDTTFEPIPDSPEGAHDVIVTDERFVMTFGCDSDFRLVQWSNQEDYTDWNFANIEGQAGFLHLPGTGKLIRGIKVLNQILVLSENEAYVGRYSGPPYVYGFERIAEHCGVIGPEAVAVTDSFAMWLSGLNFFIFDGTVKKVPCEVMGYYIDDHDFNQRSKTVAFTIHDFSEIWWLYQSNQSENNEVDSYLVYNYELNKWYFGRLDRTWGADSDPLTFVFMVDQTGILFDHEVPSAGRDDRVPFIETGPLETDNGEFLTGVAYVFPDARNHGDVRMELSVRDNANDASPRYSRDFALTDPTSTMGVMGRDIRMKLYGTLESPNWRIGNFRVQTLANRGPRR